MSFEIETGIAIPDHRVRATKYPWGSLEVGQSFFVEGEAKFLAASAYSWAKFHAPEKKFSVRKVEGGVRAWRVA